MNNRNWQKEIDERKNEIISDTQVFLRINSVLDEESVARNAPFGKGIMESLNYLLTKGEADGFKVKNLDGYAGYIEFGEGEESVGILCHVDVVPEGDGWTSPPFSAEIREGRIYARGAIDDKGPTMAAYHAMKLVKDLGLSLNRRVRMIIGTDEESTWQCVDHYFKHEEMPTVGFAPDADFPIIYAEKGICDFQLIHKGSEEEGDCTLVSFTSGRRFNMVPDKAEAVVQFASKDNIAEEFEQFIANNQLKGACRKESDGYRFTLEGMSAHGMEPKKGKNAGLFLAKFLSGYSIGNGKDFLSFISEYFVNDSRGKGLGIAYTDEITGDLTINIGTIQYAENVGKIGVNMRYPVTTEYEAVIKTIKEKASEKEFECNLLDNSKPHHVDKNHPLIKTLQKVYQNQTGEEATLLSIGGGTYARSLESGVAFGPLFPGREEVAHQKDEYIEIEDLLKATSIYAEAIYELSK
ncbi:dipeptidase PepV [Bacillus sp. FJAT-45350]|uniref:dipeptidase PepV n=1 Tax=Bacillus sp. FJAT-45350 TaxID=2011014 RepID=UPI000BB8E74C|nr:dipeptidase PepV [Bacillus sp. FJAT-45350]